MPEKIHRWVEQGGGIYKAPFSDSDTGQDAGITVKCEFLKPEKSESGYPEVFSQVPVCFREIQMGISFFNQTEGCNASAES